MTRLASANARASLVLVSYSCGSAFGSVTTLCTFTFDPPSWVARLPQKFSAAITTIEPEGAEIDPPQAAANKPKHPKIANFSGPIITQEYCTTDLRKLCAYSQIRGPAKPSERPGEKPLPWRRPAPLVNRRAARSRRSGPGRRRLLDGVPRRFRPRAR